ncbi:eukaryotic translation initiation factor 4G-like [Quercus lobata]|uniref:eukaryotic translation initiation factor 4G-like n=1 Tax=Quercus lobata TaxID=97700 RepID=UPI001249271E|nr:eukaryotic translation initiation factor 4G-like [Quercus lobata]
MASVDQASSVPVPDPVDSSDSNELHPDPYCLKSGDNPGSILVTELLIGRGNYPSWSRAMVIALTAKNKIEFINGVISKPEANSPLYKAWTLANTMVLSWIYNSVNKNIKSSVTYNETARQVWLDLKHRFDQGNAARIYSLQKAISHISQNNLLVSDYFTNFKTLSDELMNCDPLPECSCGAMRILTEKFEKDCVMKFLMGLNENYAAIRTQVLMADPMPDLNKVYSMVLHEEMQKNISSSSSSEIEAAALYSNVSAKSNLGNRYGNRKERPICSHCGIQGHIIDNCYKLHGYPPGYKPKGKSSSANQVSNFIGNDQLVMSNSGSMSTTGSLEHQAMKCPITQEQCQQLIAFLNSQSLDGSQVGSSHQATNVVATGLHSQAMVQHPLMPNFTVPLPQRPIGDDSITLGPQGGLAKGMSITGPPAMSSAPAAEISPGAADSRRMAVGLNGYSMVSERTTYGPREELVPRYIPDRFAAPAAYDQSSPQERYVNFGRRDLRNPDRSFDRSVVTSPTSHMEGAAVPQNVPSEKLPEERLKDMSIAVIKEFYSARDEKEVKLCIRDMNAPSFDKLFEQVKAVNIDNPDTLICVVSQIFDKALMEPSFCEMYANFCSHLSVELPDFSKDNEKITFKRVLLKKCQEEFERGEREQEEANKADEEGEIKQSAEEREEKRIKARRRMLGNIRLIGELYKKKMLTERIMHACIQKLLGQYDNPDEEDIEALCELMSTIGEMIDHSKAKENMDAYFERMKAFSNNMNLSSRVRFMLKDSIELRKNKWQQRRKVEGPKKIEEVHRDAAQERQAQTSRLGGRGSINTSTRRTPMDFGSRGSTMLSPSSAQMGGFRGLPSQVRGLGGQDVRFEDRVPYEARTLSVPLPQRPIGDDSITHGPQGDLARGMSIRGPPAMSSAPAAEISPGAADPRRMAVGLNGYSMVSERTTYGPREELIPRYIPDRFAPPAAYDQSSPQECNVNFGNRDLKNPDQSFDRSVVTSPTPRMEGAAVPQNVPSEKLPEERLKDMSIAAIKEFYSARDEKEVELCIRDMNAPSFHPSMVSLWVTDSFERKDMERDVLTKLLVNLTKSRDGVLNQAQLIKGFESVMTNLEDAVNDAPRAPEFLGRLFAEVITENVVPLSEIGRLIYQGGAEPGCLLELGLAADVLGSTLEVMKSEKGDSVLNELCKSSNLRIEDFRPPNPNRSRKLDKFI